VEERIYDVIIIGGGPAGLTAAIYTSRDKLDTLLLEKEIAGGTPTKTHLIENYPGFPEGISGIDLMERFKKQAKRFGVQFREFEEVKGLSSNDKTIEVEMEKGRLIARTVIIASGSEPKRIGIPGEDRFFGRGLSYCATCDGPLFKGKDVAVIGCGNSGFQEGEMLLNHVNSITFVTMLPYINASKILEERLRKHENVRFFLNHQLLSIDGEDHITSITLKDSETGEEKEIEVSGVFMYAGITPNTKFVEKVVDLNENGYIVTNESMQTSVSGVFAAGDIRSKKYQQITGACNDGTIAALSAAEYIKEGNGKTKLHLDP
jgi:thioredoxin reductase (NADPH)